MLIDIDKLTESELVALNDRVVARLRQLRQVRAQVHMLQFKVGDRVCFEVDTCDVVCGTLIRHNKKSVTVRADDGGTWRVSPSFLHRMDESMADDVIRENVVNLAQKS